MKFRIVSSFALLLLSLGCVKKDNQPGVRTGDSESEKAPKVGRLGVPLKKVVTIRGLVVEGPMKGAEGGPNLAVQYIDDVYTQKLIQIPLRGAVLKLGQSYELVGYETGSWVGMSDKEIRRILDKGEIVPQTTGRYFRPDFVVARSKLIKRVEYAPSMFESSAGVLSGMAKT